MSTKKTAEVEPLVDAPALRTASNNFLQLMVDYAVSLGNSVSLHTASPGTAGASEVAGAGYARQTTTWGASTVVGGIGQSVGTDIQFTVPANTTVTHFGVWNGAAFQYGAALNPPITVGPGAGGQVIVSPVYQEVSG